MLYLFNQMESRTNHIEANSLGHLWRDKWTALSGPLSHIREKSTWSNIHQVPLPLSSEFGTCKTVRTGIWSWDSSSDFHFKNVKTSRRCSLFPHESTHANRFTSQLLDYCPGNTSKASIWSRHSALSALLRDQTNGSYYTHLQ